MKRRFLLTRVGWVVASFAMFLAPRVMAQNAKPGRVTGRAFETLAKPLTIVVAPLDDSAENLRVRDEIRRLLQLSGQRVVESGATWRLSFATEVRPLGAGGSAGSSGAESLTGRFLDTTERPTTNLPDRPLYRAPGATAPGAARSLRYVINATVEDAKTGKRAWQGNVQYDDAESDRARFLVRLVQPLLSEFGKTQQGRRFTLD